MTQEELAERAGHGLSVSTISNIERGRTRPYRHTLQVRCQALELDEVQQNALSEAWRPRERRTHAEPSPVTAPSPAPLPAPLTPLRGEESEQDSVSRLLRRPAVRLLPLFGAGSALRESSQMPPTPIDADERTKHAWAEEAARAAIGDEKFDAQWCAGRELSPEQAMPEASEI